MTGKTSPLIAQSIPTQSTTTVQTTSNSARKNNFPITPNSPAKTNKRAKPKTREHTPQKPYPRIRRITITYHPNPYQYLHTHKTTKISQTNPAHTPHNTTTTTPIHHPHSHLHQYRHRPFPSLHSLQSTQHTINTNQQRIFNQTKHRSDQRWPGITLYKD